MKGLNWKVIVTSVFCVFLTTACSKKLMPPEIETSGGVSEETELTASSSGSSERELGGSGGAEDSGVFSEEPILEHGPSSGSLSTDSPGSSSAGSSGPGGLGGSGGGDLGSSEANPFASGGGSGSGIDSGVQESRLQSFGESSELKDIHFKFDKYDLDNNSRAILKGNADYLKHNPSLQIEVHGHCDERGTNNYNIALGERRAHSTKTYLVSQGVNSKRVRVISFGEEKPFCFDSNDGCWSENRRAHFRISD